MKLNMVSGKHRKRNGRDKIQVVTQIYVTKNFSLLSQDEKLDVIFARILSIEKNNRTLNQTRES